MMTVHAFKAALTPTNNKLQSKIKAPTQRNLAQTWKNLTEAFKILFLLIKSDFTLYINVRCPGILLTKAKFVPLNYSSWSLSMNY